MSEGFTRESYLDFTQTTRRQLLLGAAAGSFAFLAGIPRVAAQDKPKVGLVMKSLANEFFKQMEAGAEAYAAGNADKFSFKAVGMKEAQAEARKFAELLRSLPERLRSIEGAPAGE